DVAEECRQWGVDGERDVILARELAEAPGPVVVHPEAALEVDLAGGVAALEEDRDRLVGAVVRGDARRAEPDFAHAAYGSAGTSRPYRPVPGAVRPGSYHASHGPAPEQNRSPRARHRPPPQRPVAGGVRRDRVERRGRRRVYARRLRQGLLRCAHRGPA